VILGKRTKGVRARSLYVYMQCVYTNLPTSELVNLFFRVPQRLQYPQQLSLIRRTRLAPTDTLIHSRRPTHKDLNIPLLRLRQHRLQQLLAYIPLPLHPPLTRLIQHIKRLKPLRIRIFQLLKLMLQQDILLLDVAEHERDFRPVVGILEDGPAELVHGRDAGAAGDERDVVVLVLGPGVFGEGAFHVEALAGGHAVEMFGHGAVGVALDYEVEVAADVFVADGGVGT